MTFTITWAHLFIIPAVACIVAVVVLLGGALLRGAQRLDLHVEYCGTAVVLLKLAALLTLVGFAVRGCI